MRAEQRSGPSMLALVSDMTGPTLWRVLQPITALEAAGYPCGWDRADNVAARALIGSYDGLLIARSGWQRAARRIVEGFLREAHDGGRFVVMDLDDDILTAGFSQRQIDLGWNDGKPFEQLEAERMERIWAVRQVDGLTVSTPHLADVVESFTDRPVVVVPNAIDVPWFRSAVRRHARTIPGVTIGWAGGKRPDDDVASMAAGWARIAQRYPSVTFVVAGYLPPIIRKIIPPERVVVLPWLPLERYPESLGAVDIACAAVADDRFNASKSVIKAYEAAIAGSAVVATPYLYGQLIRHGVNGMLAETTVEWADALAQLIERPSLRALLAKRLERHVERQCSLRENLSAWPAAWQAIAEGARARNRRLVVR